MRPEAPSEKKLHKAVLDRSVAENAAKGGLLGAGAGAALKRLGHNTGPVAGAFLGTAVGAHVGRLQGEERKLRDTTTQERQHMRAEARTKKAEDVAFDKISALTPMVRPGLLEKSQYALMKTRAPTAPKAPMPGTFAIKTSMVHPEAQAASEKMTPAGWKQTVKDVPLSILAGGVGYGIGRTLTEIIGENLHAGKSRPGWMTAMPAVMAVLSASGAYAGSRVRDGLAERRKGANR